MRVSLNFDSVFRCLTTVFVIGASLFSQETSLETSAAKMIKAIVEQDYATIVDNTYQGMVEIGGGKNLFVQNAKMNNDGNIASGITIIGAKFLDNTTIIELPNERQSIIRYEITANISSSLFKCKSYLLAISNRKSNSWRFVDLRTLDKSSIKEFVPSYSDLNVFPTNEGFELIQKK